MKIRQNIRHFAARKALQAPVLGDIVSDKLVSLHTKVFLERAPSEQAEERRERLEEFFDASMDAYITALHEDYSEAEAREMTHIMANLEFYRKGWTEMMEFPVHEVEDHFERHSDFFSAHGVSTEEPLGEFAPKTLPSAPSTPEKLSDPVHPYAEQGHSDDVYVETSEGVRKGGREEPDNIDIGGVPGVSEE